MHPKVDFEYWASVFPLTSQNLGGEIITSPAHLCQVELVRKRYRQVSNLGRAVPVDIFLWSVKSPEEPFLTKLGGVPHRESAKAWPIGEDGKAYTFVAQFCFLDSKDIVSDNLPNDVMLIFFRDADSAGTRVQFMLNGVQ